MTTVKQLIEFLETLPPDTEVVVMENVSTGYEYYSSEVSLDLDPIDGNYKYSVGYLVLGEA